MDGLLLIDKPAGMTSHDVIDALRRITGIRRIGHAGTLDPFATGLLVVGVGRATKTLAAETGKEKAYVATAMLGASSTTQDLTGELTPTPGVAMPTLRSASRPETQWSGVGMPTEERIRELLPRFTGTITQIPPMYSAKKIGGRKLYELARAGQEVEREPVTITVHEFSIISYEPPRLTFKVRSSPGTYIRTLAHDLGAALGTGAYLESLRRTAIGQYPVERAVKLSDLTKENWVQHVIPEGPMSSPP